MDQTPAGAAMGSLTNPVIAVLIPCHNEEAAIGKVVADFRKSLPDAAIFVYDNNSTDRTAEIARKAGAIVRHETQPGKGNVVRRMFADVEADVYVLVDGDDTYDASAAPMLIEHLLTHSLDMVNASRVETCEAAYRPGHRFGNRFLTGVVASLFGKRLRDMLSGYRVFSRRFVKSFPSLSSGFEIETELTVHALELRLPIAEIPVPYRDRPTGSVSKLRAYSDGFRILRMIIRLIKEEKPLQFFGFFFVLFASGSIILEIPVILTYLETGLVPRLPTAVLGTGMMLLAFLSLTCGLVLDTVTRGRIEAKRMHYSIRCARLPGGCRACECRACGCWAERACMLRQFLMFALVGAAGFLVDAGTLQVTLHLLGLNLYTGRLVSFLVAATFTWQLNRKFTFRAAAANDPAAKQWMKFLSANAIGGLINLGVYALLVSRVPLAREHPTLAVACGAIAGLLFNFLASRIVVFRAHLLPAHRA